MVTNILFLFDCRVAICHADDATSSDCTAHAIHAANDPVCASAHAANGRNGPHGYDAKWLAVHWRHLPEDEELKPSEVDCHTETAKTCLAFEQLGDQEFAH